MSAVQRAPASPPLVSFLVSLALACAIPGRSPTMRIAFPLVIYLDRRYLSHHIRTFSRPAVDFQVAAQQCHPLTHAGETQTLAGSTTVGDLLRVEAGSPIPHLQANRVVQATECDPHPG